MIDRTETIAKAAWMQAYGWKRKLARTTEIRALVAVEVLVMVERSFRDAR
jgi:hypothetical protein